ncbi:MAG: tRNA (N6-isopentenyl adenosine(37)-C2)-methylthiotransferase MiaB [Lachnospiraceae bacterium]|nr:tRNA (N6-isopentenyl adenosine(37)-C2)-methylthiotransferase MiaB [Lachnospiraceae bacterium]
MDEMMRRDIADIDSGREAEDQRPYLEEGRRLVESREKELGRKLTCCVVTFGCQMNARDSEKLLGVLLQMGFEDKGEDENADFVVYNTCTVRDHANQRVYGRLGTLHGYKRRNPDMKIALCGCMMQEEAVIEKIRKSYRFVDLLFGTHNLYTFPRLVCDMLQSNRMIISVWKQEKGIVEELPVSRKYPFKSGVNIMFGCNNFCSYCIVPYVRGRERSRNAKDIIREVERLASEGVKEVMLLGQNVNSYGNDLDGEMNFPSLLREVEKVDGIERIRFMSSHPKDLSDELIDVMAGSTKICRHLHLALQSGSDRILKAMNRHYTKEDYLLLTRKLREKIPDLALTTDIIVGFPGEELSDVEETIDVIRKAEFENAFTFIYSIRTGTPAAKMEQVDEKTAKKHFDMVLSEVQQSARNRAGRYEGEVMEALVEEVNEHDSSLLTGRLSNNTIVHFPGDPSLIGQILPIRLAECRGFYYVGKKV